MDIIYGAYQKAAVDLAVNSKKLHIKSPFDSVSNGIAFLPERGHRTVFSGKTIIENMVVQVANFKEKGIFIKRTAEFNFVSSQVSKYGIRGYSSLDKKLNSLSGGNMQKVLLARSMMLEPKVLMLFEPTQGIDIAAKTEVKNLILRMAREGNAVIIVTAEIDDIIDICNKAIIIRDGRLKAAFDVNEANKNEIAKSSAS
jgi:ABC-type sugar transport system ATPase subunit